MGRIEEELSAVVAEAIGRQLDDAPIGGESEDQRVQRLTAHQLVKDALAGGQFGAVTVSGLHSFAGGNTAMLVARVNTTLTFVVKVDHRRSLQKLTTCAMRPPTLGFPKRPAVRSPRFSPSMTSGRSTAT